METAETLQTYNYFNQTLKPALRKPHGVPAKCKHSGGEWFDEEGSKKKQD